MSISCKGYGENVLTFNTKLTEVGAPVYIGADNKALLASADNDFVGFTTYADGEIAGVIVDGYVEVPFTGAAPSYGFTSVVSNGKDGVKSSITSKHVVRVLKIDNQNKIVGFIL